jgi:hypothetical protein
MLDKENDFKYIVYRNIGSRCILDRSQFKIKNYKSIAGEFVGVDKNRGSENGKYSKQDIVKQDEEFVFYNKGKKINNHKEVLKKCYTYNGQERLEIFVYISKKIYKVNNKTYCSLGKVYRNTTEEGLKKPKTQKGKEHYQNEKKLPVNFNSSYEKYLIDDDIGITKEDIRLIEDHERSQYQKIFGAVIDHFDGEERIKKERKEEIKRNKQTDEKMIKQLRIDLELDKPIPKPIHYYPEEEDWFKNI